jgi:hypothetical protein
MQKKFHQTRINHTQMLDINLSSNVLIFSAHLEDGARVSGEYFFYQEGLSEDLSIEVIKNLLGQKIQFVSQSIKIVKIDDPLQKGWSFLKNRKASLVTKAGFYNLCERPEY